MRLLLARFVFVAACSCGLLAALYLYGQQPDSAADGDDQAVVTDQDVEETDGDATDNSATPQGVSLRDWAGLIGIFVLAIFVGFEVITKVPPTLHTPLMSGSNAISGITLVGAVIVAGVGAQQSGSAIVGAIAVALATINVVGGFLVTHRMLAMFSKRR